MQLNYPTSVKLKPKTKYEDEKYDNFTVKKFA